MYFPDAKDHDRAYTLLCDMATGMGLLDKAKAVIAYRSWVDSYLITIHDQGLYAAFKKECLKRFPSRFKEGSEIPKGGFDEKICEQIFGG